ncbi:MAG: glycoside hydrolase family 10 [Paenibacillaceae bacterium]|nr:glycoside hydrolase family 10 [Paenibacillaceae bacterium]
MSKPSELLRYFEQEERFVGDRIEQGIEENRKGWASLVFVDAEGQPAEGLEVQIEQLTHDFKFGANIFMLDGFETEEKNEKFSGYFRELYNLAVVPFYWNALEPEHGKPRFGRDSEPVYRRPAPDLVLDYCERYGLEPKGHTLIWHQMNPEWLPMDKIRSRPFLNERMKRIGERYAGRIPAWDVVNEPNERYYFPTVVLPEDYLYDSFVQAAKFFPGNRLFVNEATRYSWIEFNDELSPYYLLIQNLLLRGIQLGGIGMQYHLFLPREELHEKAELYLSPERLLRVLDRYADFRLPIHISEITLSAYGDEEEEEQVQAEILRRLYRLWFSHPAVEAVVYWNSNDGYTYQGEEKYMGGLFRRDFTPKPSCEVLRNLIQSEWRTNLELKSEDGQAAFRGFYGTYRITVRQGEKTVSKTIHLGKHSLKQFELTV